MVLDAFPVAAVVAGHVVAVDSVVVARISVSKTVDEDLIDDLIAPIPDIGLVFDGAFHVTHIETRIGRHG